MVVDLFKKDMVVDLKKILWRLKKVAMLVRERLCKRIKKDAVDALVRERYRKT